MNSKKNSNKVNIDRNHQKKNHKNETVMFVDFDCDVDNDDFSTINDENNDRSNDNSDCDNDDYIDNDSDSDFNSIAVFDENLNIDDDCNVESEETRTFLYQHFIIIIVVNETSERFNLVFMKIILLHIKEKNNNSWV